MPTVRETIEQLEDQLGFPIILLTAIDKTTGKPVDLRLRDLPIGGTLFVIQWLNDRLSTPG